MKSDGKILNKEQTRAAQHGAGPLVIIAGAGTGKTTVVTERIKWLISQNLAKPSEILALTFTDKAAREMEERVDRALPYGYTQMWISTFHSFGEKIMRQEAFHIGLDPGYKLITEAEAILFFRKNLFAFELEYFRPLGNPAKFIEGMLGHFSRLKDEDTTPQQYLEWVNKQSSRAKSRDLLQTKVGEQDPSTRHRLGRDDMKVQKANEEELIEIEKYEELARAYQKYEELKVKNGMMDFGDLISNTLRLFRERKNILKNYQDQFKYILIDEFQDANFAQNELAILLSGKRKNITVVGDDDQAIYRWRGAAISNIVHFRERFPESKMVVLTKNYRSSREILDRSYTLIQHNNPDRLEVKEHIDKKLTSERNFTGKRVEFLFCDRVEDEAEEVVKNIKYQISKIKNDLGEPVYSWKDIAILVRANSHADAFTRALGRAGIPYQFLGPGMLFRQSEIMDLIAYLTALNNFHDSVAFYRVLSMDVFGIAPRDIAACMSLSKKIGVSLFEATEVIAAQHSNDTAHWSRERNYQGFVPYLQKETKEKLVTIVQMIHRHLGMIQKETAGQILYYFLEDSGLLQTLTQFQNVIDERKAQNISKFFDRLKSFETERPDASVSSAVDWINMSLEMGESPLAANIDWSENDAVNILTVHSSKGLEFPVVYLVNLVSNRFPSTERREKIPIPDALVKEILPEGDHHEQEERRVFYVGMTRGRDRLILSAAKYYGEAKRERKISPFVVESLGEDVLKQHSVGQEVKQLSLMDWKKADDGKDEKPGEKQVRQPVNYLSYSQINTFLTCPLQYRYRYILRIPVPTSAAASFGTTMHIALQKFYEVQKNSTGVIPSDPPAGGESRNLTPPNVGVKEIPPLPSVGRDDKVHPTKETLLKILDEVWIPVGYGTKEYEDKMKKRGRDMLTTFFEKAYDPNIVPKSLEQIFKFKLPNGILVGGKIDRVDTAGDNKLEIIDYKTGKRPSEKEIAENLQMTVYAIAATDSGIYNKKAEDVILTFYFFDALEKISSTRTPEQLEKAKEKLVKIAEEIATSDFKPTPGPWCDFCDFRLICPAWK